MDSVFSFIFSVQKLNKKIPRALFREERVLFPRTEDKRHQEASPLTTNGQMPILQPVKVLNTLPQTCLPVVLPDGEEQHSRFNYALPYRTISNRNSAPAPYTSSIMYQLSPFPHSGRSKIFQAHYTSA
jgi:hypothetical protein